MEIVAKEPEVLSMIFWFGCLSIVSVGMTIGNKFVMMSHFRTC